MAAERPEVVAMPWPDFLDWSAEAWTPGEHYATVAPTGAGKTTFNCGIIEHCRQFSLGFDLKGGDSTLRGSGWTRLPKWPPSIEDYRAMEKGEARRFIVGPVCRTIPERRQLARIFEEALEGAFADRGWTIYVDELQLFADKRFGNLSALIEEYLIAARDAGMSTVTAFQRPSNVPRAASEMATWIATAYTRDRDTVMRLSEMFGRPAAEVRGALRGLDPYTWLIVGRDPREPYRVTRPYAVRRVRSAS